jgi:hypothetical protein
LREALARSGAAIIKTVLQNKIREEPEPSSFAFACRGREPLADQLSKETESLDGQVTILEYVH